MSKSGYRVAMEKVSSAGFFEFDGGWYARIQEMLPFIGLRLAVSNGLPPERDGQFILSPLHYVNARVDPGPRYTIYAGAVLALIDAALDYPAGSEPTLMVHRRFGDYRRIDGQPGFPVFDKSLFGRRPQILSCLLVYGLSFLLLHEQSHFTEGHLLYLESLGVGQCGATYFLEAAEEGTASSVDPLTYRALEIDADAHACITQFYAAATSSDAPPMTPAWIEARQADVKYSFVGAATMMAILTVVDHHSNANPAERKHPSAALRTIMLLKSYVIFLQECGLQPAKLEELINDALEHLTVIYGHMGIQDELELAVLAYRGDLEETHPLQQERKQLFFHYLAIEPAITACAARVMQNLGVPLG